MKNIISAILIVCFIPLLLPGSIRAAEAQKAQLTGSELTSLNSFDDNSLDNVSAEGKKDSPALKAANITANIIVVTILLIPIVSAAAILIH